MDELGFVRITDRTKDLIKSGGEWISSVDLENALMAHLAVAEAAVIAIPDPEVGERPLACVVFKPGGEGRDRRGAGAHLLQRSCGFATGLDADSARTRRGDRRDGATTATGKFC